MALGLFLGLSPKAEIDLREIDDFIASDNPQRAASFAGELLAHSERIIHGIREISDESFDLEEP